MNVADKYWAVDFAIHFGLTLAESSDTMAVWEFVKNKTAQPVVVEL